MKTLKNKSTVLLVLILATALLLSACGTAAILASQDSGSTADLTSANSDSAVNYVALSAEGSQNSAQPVSSSEAFSNRDLSGDYDTAEAVTISLNGTSASASSASVQISGGTVTITAAGTYILSGTLDNGSIIVNATKDDKIQLVLDGVTIRSETFAAIYVVQADKVFVTLAESSVNTLTNGGSFVQSDDNDVDAVIFAKDDITLNGAGKLVMRDRDSGSYPRSVAEALDMLDTWLYGGDPAEGLLVEDVLRSLEEKLETDYYLDLLRELFLPERPSAVVVLTPSHTVGAEKAQREAARIAAARAGWTEAEREAMIRQEEDLAVWQQTPDPPEALATIPMLRLSDLNDRPEPLPMTVKQRGTTTLLYHETGSGLAWLRTFFNVSDLLPEELPLLSLLAGLLGILPTARHDAKDLQVLIKQTVGALEFQPVVYAGSDPDHCRVIFAARTACLPEQAERAAALLTELLTETVFRDRGQLRDVLKQTAMDMQMSLSSMGQQFALTRVSAAGSAHGAAREYLGGIAFADWIKTQSAADDETLDRLLLGMETIARRSFRSQRLTVSCSELVPEAALDALSFSCGGPCPAEAAYEPLESGRTLLAIPSDVGFAAMGTNFRRHGRTFSGCLPVLANLLNYTFLWNEIRVQGGAYGCGFQARDDGDAAFHTYRDPQPHRSVEVMKQAAGFLRDFCSEQPDLTGFILSSVSALDPLLDTASRMDVAEHRWFKGTSREDVCQCYRQLLHTTPEDLLDLCGMLEELASDGTVCILAGTEQLNGRTQSFSESCEEA